MAKRLVMIGNGMAGMRTIDELLAIAPGEFEITVFGREPYGNYNRIMLSPVLAEEATFDSIMIHTPEWYAEYEVTLFSGDPIVSIDRDQKQVVSQQGRRVDYDVLLLATGSNPFIIPVPGHDLDGVIAYRDIHDVQAMQAAARQYQHAVVIGGGLLGLEAAYGLHKQGMHVTVVHLLDSLMERQLDKTAATLLQQTLEAQGIHFAMEHATKALHANDQGRVHRIEFADGKILDADLVVMAVGIKPNIDLAQHCALACERGVMVDDHLRTQDPHIFAVGECAQHRGVAYGLVAPLYDQAKICAEHIAQTGQTCYEGTVLSTKLKVTGIDLFSAGDFTGQESSELIVYEDLPKGVYKKLVIEDNVLIGCVLYGDVADGNLYFTLIDRQACIADIRHDLIFGEAYIDPKLIQQLTMVNPIHADVKPEPVYAQPKVAVG